jgi:hypothetical protein
LRFCRPGIFKAFAKNGEERNKKKERSRKMKARDGDWMRNTLARITQLAYAGFMDFDTVSVEESDCRIRSALRRIGQLLINRGVSSDGVRMADRQMFRKCALDWLERFVKELGRDDYMESAARGDALEMLATFVCVNSYDIVAGVADEFGLDPAVEARRADELGAVARRDVFGSECVDGESADGDASIAAEMARRGLIRRLGFAFALQLADVAKGCIELRFEGCDLKVERGNLAAAKKRTEALRVFADALAKLENGGDVGDVHGVMDFVGEVLCRKLYQRN